MGEKKDIIVFIDEDEMVMELSSKVNKLNATTVETQEDFKKASEFLVATHATIKAVEQFYDPELKEAQKEKAAAEAKRKAVDNQIKKLTDPLSKAKEIVQARLSAYLQVERMREQERIRIENEKRAEVQQEATGPTAPEVPSEVVPPPVDKVKVQGLREVEKWSVEVVDLSLVPRDYLIFNQAKANSDVQTLKDLFKVPGLRAVKTVSMVPTGR